MGSEYRIHRGLRGYRLQRETWEIRLEVHVGLYVTETLNMRLCVSVFICSALLLVPASKMMLGTWEAAFAAGCYLLAIPVVWFAPLAHFK